MKAFCSWYNTDPECQHEKEKEVNSMKIILLYACNGAIVKQEKI